MGVESMGPEAAEGARVITLGGTLGEVIMNTQRERPPGLPAPVDALDRVPIDKFDPRIGEALVYQSGLPD